MRADPLIILGALLLCASACLARDVTSVNPTYPRLGNCYGSGLGWRSWEEGAEYWSKLDLFIGGGYDLHYDWDDARWPAALARIEGNVARLREANPHALVLPYVDVVEGPDNPSLPSRWWDLRDGERWSGWPGYFRVNTGLPEVLQYNLDRVSAEIIGRECFDGVFYDCWRPDPWLVPRTAALRDGKAAVMLNDWNLPTEGFESLNGCLAEDELNRVVEGKVDFEDFLARYLRWSAESRKPAVTMIVCHPREMDMDPWRWAKVSWEERRRVSESLRTSDPQMMRFGLTTTLMGDGYFGYDCANLGRGHWWWYPEYDAPLGQPKGPACRNADGARQREFDGGLVVVNGIGYDTVVELATNSRDISTGRVGRRFTLPMWDGRIFLPTDEPPTPGEDTPPRLTASPPATLRAVVLDDGVIVAQTPGGLELRFEPTGELRRILFRGSSVMSGGWPMVARPPMTLFTTEAAGVPEVETATETASLTFHGALVEEDQRVEYAEACSIGPDNRFALRFDFTARSDLDLRLWRHYFTFPVRAYAGATARGEGESVTLPAELGNEALLAASKRVAVAGQEAVVTIESTIPMSLVDHRKWGSPEYLLAGYPVGGQVKAGATWSVEISVTVNPALKEG